MWHGGGLSAVPHLFLWGDYLDRQPLWAGISRNQRGYAQALRASGVDVTWIDLPVEGMQGNSPMLMMDRNSDQVAERIQAWMVTKGLLR